MGRTVNCLILTPKITNQNIKWSKRSKVREVMGSNREFSDFNPENYLPNDVRVGGSFRGEMM